MAASAARTLLRQAIDVASNAHRHTLRRLLPTRRVIALAGVDTGQEVKVGDGLFRGRFPDRESNDRHETALVAGLKAHLRPGDRCVVIGGGWGITAIVAARQVGEAGKVWAYEGSRSQLDIAEDIVRHNGIENIELINRIVGPEVGVYNSGWEGPNRLGPLPVADLPDHDFLEMDCEGSEISILRTLEHRPRQILVETHGFLGTPTAEVRAQLEGMGYTVEDLGVAEASIPEVCRKNDIMVLLGTR